MKEWLFFKETRRAGMRASATAVVLVPLALLSPQPTHAASFNCAKAATPVEKMICTNAELSKLDDDLAKAYRGALRWATDRAALKVEQRAWLRSARDACADTACLKVAYEVRIGELEKIAKPAPVGEGAFSARQLPSAEARQPANDQEPKHITKGYLLTHPRPEDFFRLIWSRDGAFCRRVLQALNEPITFPERGKARDEAWWHIGSRFLKNDYSVPWQPLEVERGGYRVAWRMVVDINGDGEKEALYRFGYYLTGVLNFVLMWSTEYPNIETYLSRERISKIKEQNESIWGNNNNNNEKEQRRRYLSRYSREFLDVIKVDKEYYYMAADAAAYYGNSKIHVSAKKLTVKYNKKTPDECIFESNYIFANK